MVNNNYNQIMSYLDVIEKELNNIAQAVGHVESFDFNTSISDECINYKIAA